MMHSKKIHVFLFGIAIIFFFWMLCYTPNVFSLENTSESFDRHSSYQKENEISEYVSIRHLLSDKNLSDKKIYFRGSDTGGDGIVNQFIENITLSLIEDATASDTAGSANYYMAKDSLNEEINQYQMFNGEIKEINYIKRQMATNAFIKATLDYLETSAVYNKVKSFEETVSKYFFLEYRKEISKDKGTQNLSDTSALHKKDTDNLFKLSLSALFYSSADTFKGDYSLKLQCSYLGTEASTLYDFGKNELKFRLKNEYLNSCLSSNWDFTIIKNNDDITTFLLKVLFNY